MYTDTKIPDNYYLLVSDTRYSNDFLCMKGLRYFDLYSAQRQIGTYPLLLQDSYSSYCTREFIEYCNNAKIITFCLPSYTSYLLQPLDVIVFQPYKHFHSEAIEAATRTECTDFDQVEFLTTIHQQKKFHLMYYIHISLNHLVIPAPLIPPIPLVFTSCSKGPWHLLGGLYILSELLILIFISGHWLASLGNRFHLAEPCCNVICYYRYYSMP